MSWKAIHQVLVGIRKENCCLVAVSAEILVAGKASSISIIDWEIYEIVTLKEARIPEPTGHHVQAGVDAGMHALV